MTAAFAFSLCFASSISIDLPRQNRLSKAKVSRGRMTRIGKISFQRRDYKKRSTLHQHLVVLQGLVLNGKGRGRLNGHASTSTAGAN